MQGFHLTELALVDADEKDAAVPFDNGLSVVEGSSDTGKSFVFECIDFVMGGKKLRTIPEARPFQQIRLRMRTLEGQEFELRRALSGGAAIVRERKGNAWGNVTTLAVQHDHEDAKNISMFLLGLTGMPLRWVRTTDYGVKRTFSFRDFARFLCIDEVLMITKDSPIISRLKTQTADKRVFTLILTGQDDGGITASTPPQELKFRSAGELTMLDRLINDLEQEIAKKTADTPDWETSLGEKSAEIDATLASLRHEQVEVADQEVALQTAHADISENERRVLVNEELLARFQLLAQQYTTDISRLDAIGEAGHFFAQLQPERCPTCGALPEHHDTSAAWHLTSPSAIAEVKQAAVAEAQKIKLNHAKLSETIAGLVQENKQLAATVLSAQKTYQSAQQVLKDTFTPRAKELAVRLEQLSKEQATYTEIATLRVRLKDLENVRVQTAAGKKAKKGDFGSSLPSSDALEDFNLIVEGLLVDWGLPDVGRVTFNHELADIVIGGKDRGASGKGVRGIAYAAFVIGLMKYCQKVGLPHPGFVVLDSPLLTYKKPDTSDDEALSHDVVDGFYRYLAKAPKTEQVIVFENEEPPEDIKEQITYTHFSKTTSGRYGFLPQLLIKKT